MTQKEADSLMAHIQAVHGQHAAKMRKLAGPDHYVIVLEVDDYHIWIPDDYNRWLHMRDDALEERMRTGAATILQAVQG